MFLSPPLDQQEILFKPHLPHDSTVLDHQEIVYKPNSTPLDQQEIVYKYPHSPHQTNMRLCISPTPTH